MVAGYQRRPPCPIGWACLAPRPTSSAARQGASPDRPADRHGRRSDGLWQRKVELAGSPRQRDLRLRTLEVAHGWSCVRRWQASADGEEPCDCRCEQPRIGQYFPRRRATFQGETRKPKCDVEVPVSDTRKVPVEEKSVPAAQAEVVAPHVEVEQFRSVKLGVLARLQECWECFFQPRGSAESCRKHRFWVCRDVRPADNLAADRLELLDLVRRSGAVQRVE